ncbi:MAG: aldehyde dehydrogenase (NADP(+)), partial [Trueperaceae bacterium]|nr:aldehyde dehydrogenase (NADP(+)) [Trueperaceae bacterium]
RIDPADPDRTPAPKPDLRSMRRAIGPVAVFGASNFPFAFSVAGGDTASALAAGCPVVVKAHPGHPGTSELVGAAIADAAHRTGLPDGVFSLLFDDGHDAGAQLVRAPEIRAVGFTGSRGGGEALMRIATERPVPIPVYAEMGSVNPVFVLPGAAHARGEAIAEGLHVSFTLGVGQFCTNPGVVLVPRGADGDAIATELARRTEATPGGTMLNARVCEMYGRGIDALREAGGTPLAQGYAADGPTAASAAAWEVDLAAVRADPTLLHEVFGPSTVLVWYRDVVDLVAFARAMEGQLTATVHAEDDELDVVRPLFAVLADRAGRVLFGGFPTGVEVSPAMVHGGPFPATSDGRGTSVGTYAIERFTRFVAYQNAPQALLPEALRDR